MASKHRPSVLETWSSQLSFNGTDDELHREFKSRPIQVQSSSNKGKAAKRTNCSNKKKPSTTKKKKKRPASEGRKMRQSPLEQLDVLTTNNRSPKRKDSPSSSSHSDSSSSNNDRSAPISRQTNKKPMAETYDDDASRGSQEKRSTATTMLLLGQPRNVAETCTRKTDCLDEYSIPRKPKAATDDSSKKRPPLPSKKTDKTKKKDTGRTTAKQRSRTKSIKNNDDHDDTDDDDCIELEIPYTQDFCVVGQQSSKSAARLLGKSATEPLRAGDVIFYYNPVFVAGTKQAITVTQILAIDPTVIKISKNNESQPTEVFPLDLDNAALIPMDTYITRIKEYRDGELFPHHGIRRQMQDFRLMPGKLKGKTGIKRRMEAFKQIIAQAQQQLEDDMEKGQHLPRRDGDCNGSDDESSSGSSNSSSSDDSLVPSKNASALRERSRELVLEKARRALQSSRGLTELMEARTSVVAKDHHVMNSKAPPATVRPKGLFDHESSSSDDEETSKLAPSRKSPAKSTARRQKPPNRTTVLVDWSDPDSDSAVPSQKQRIVRMSEQKKQRNQTCMPFKSHKMNLNRSSQGTDHPKKSSSVKSGPNKVNARDRESLRQPKQAKLPEQDAILEKSQTRRPKDPMMQGLDDSTDDDEDELLLKNVLKRTTGSNGSLQQQQRPISDPLAATSKRKPDSAATTKDNAKRIKSFLYISPSKGEEERESDTVSESLARQQQEEFDMFLHGTAPSSVSKKAATVKRSKSSFHPTSVEDASSCNEFANDSTSDEDNETFFRKRKELRKHHDESEDRHSYLSKPALGNNTKLDDLSSITTTFTSQSSVEGANKTKKTRSKSSSGGGLFRLSSSGRPSHRPARMELKLQPIPQGDTF